MMRLLLLALIGTGLYFGGAWLLAHPGTIQVNWFGYDVTLHVLVAGLVLALFAGVVAFFTVLLWQVVTWPKRRRVRRQHRTFTRGLAQLTKGVTALAMGDEDAAQEALNKALIALPGEPLPKLLTAQLMQRQGRQEDARLQFRALMEHPLTAELATRHVIEQHIARREWGEAITLAEEARKTHPEDRWLVVTLIGLYAHLNSTSQMLALTEGWQWKSPLNKPERHRYAALAHYLAARLQDAPRRKEQALRHAVGYAPDFLPAILDYAAWLHAEGNARSARKWLLDAWKAQPSFPLIAPILASIAEASPRAQQRLLKPFLRGELSALHQLLIARQAMQADEHERARAALEEAIALEESKEACSLMAELVTETQNADAARLWVKRALEAPLSATWVCHDCGHLHREWHAHCGACGHFDTLNYERPEARITSVEMVTV